jgi:hypothetical protein
MSTKKLNVKKSQVGFEFLTLTVFLFVLVAILLGVGGYLMSSFSEAELVQEREEFAQVIIDEFDRAQSSPHKFNRTVKISPADLKLYEMSFIENQSLFIIKDTRLDGTGSDSEHYYFLPSDFTYNQTFFTNKTSDGTLEIKIFSNTSENLEKVDLN